MTPDTLLAMTENSLESQMVKARGALLEASVGRTDGPLRLIATFSDHVLVLNGLGAVLRLEWDAKGSLQESRIGRLVMPVRAAPVTPVNLLECAFVRMSERLEALIQENQYAIFVDLGPQTRSLQEWYGTSRSVTEIEDRLKMISSERPALKKQFAVVANAIPDALVYLTGLHIESRKGPIPDSLLGKAREAVRSIETLTCLAKANHRETT